MTVSSQAPNFDDSSLSRATSPSQQSTYDAASTTTVPTSALAIDACALSQRPISTRTPVRYEIWFGVIGVRRNSLVSGNDTGRNRYRVIALSWILWMIR